MNYITFYGVNSKENMIKLIIDKTNLKTVIYRSLGLIQFKIYIKTAWFEYLIFSKIVKKRLNSLMLIGLILRI